MGRADYRRVRSPSTGRRIAVLVLLCACGLSTATAAQDDDAAKEVRITAESPVPGSYRVTAERVVGATPRRLAEVIVDFANQCESACKIPIPGVDEIQIVHGSFAEGRMGTWTRIDDVLNATYWTAVTVTKEPAGWTVRLRHPTASELERWETPERPHKPFFHHVDGRWTLRREASTQEPSTQEPSTPKTRIEYSMEMRSDRFWINLAPSQVLRGAQRYGEVFLDYLADLKEP